MVFNFGVYGRDLARKIKDSDQCVTYHFQGNTYDVVMIELNNPRPDAKIYRRGDYEQHAFQQTSYGKKYPQVSSAKVVVIYADHRLFKDDKYESIREWICTSVIYMIFADMFQVRCTFDGAMGFFRSANNDATLARFITMYPMRGLEAKFQNSRLQKSAVEYEIDRMSRAMNKTSPFIASCLSKYGNFSKYFSEPLVYIALGYVLQKLHARFVTDSKPYATYLTAFSANDYLDAAMKAFDFIDHRSDNEIDGIQAFLDEIIKKAIRRATKEARNQKKKFFRAPKNKVQESEE